MTRLLAVFDRFIALHALVRHELLFVAPSRFVLSCRFCAACLMPLETSEAALLT